jgi:FkbM family methyltransferase
MKTAKNNKTHLILLCILLLVITLGNTLYSYLSRKSIKEHYSDIDYENILRNIHAKLKLDYGSLEEEFPEQIMSVKYLKGHEKVLELGGNIGRNSVIIAHILNKNNNHNFVSLETNTEDAKKLMHNRDINNLHFHVENAALSNRKLVQNGWQSKPVDDNSDMPGWDVVNTITWKDLNEKYKIDFDTLVLDCEGAFYYILIDTPEILDNIKTIIMENDYFDNKDQKDYVINILKENGFKLVHEAAHQDMTDFYQVWIK